jgi:predicted DNA-binding transcriptional regulator AlpA
MDKKDVCMVFAHKKEKRRAASGARTPTKPAIPLESRHSPESAPGAVLLTPQQLAVRLAVPTSWIREKTRERARVRDGDPLPVVRLGKYVRFRWSDIEAWLDRQSKGRSAQEASS